MRRVAVLASGGGTNLEAVFDYLDALGAARPAAVALVASDRAHAGALARAQRHGVATAVLERPADGGALETLLDAHAIDLVALAGYLKRVPPDVTRHRRGAVVNVHPALLPRFGGPGMYGRRVHAAVLAAGEAVSGATVHFVDEEYDHGAPIAWARIPVEPGDTADSLGARVLAAEHALYPRALHAVAIGLVTLGADGRTVFRADATLRSQILPPPPAIAIRFAGDPTPAALPT